VTVVCIAVNGAVRHRVFDTGDAGSMRDMRSFIAFQETQPCQVFYLANVAEGCQTVPSNADITAIRLVVLDFDPDKTKSLEAERDRLRLVAHDLLTGPLQPRAVVDTGGGMQAVFELIEPISVGEGTIAEVELLMKSLARSLGADTATCTAKNLFRVPFTYNWPTPAKKAAGRERSVSGLWFSGGPRTTLADLRTLATVALDDGPASAPVEFGDLAETDLIDALGEPEALPGYLIETTRDPLLLKILNRGPSDPLDRSDSDFNLACNLLRNHLTPKDTAILLSAYGYKVEETFRQERLFSYVVHTVEKAVARVKVSHLLDDFEDEADKVQAEEVRKERHARLDPLTVDEALQGLFDGSNDDLVSGLIGPKELMVLYGKPGSGKTFVMIDMAYHIAQGAAWNERSVAPVKVVYIATESARGILFRLAALKDRYGPAADFYIIPSSVNMFDRRLDLKPLMDRIANKVGTSVGLIVIDTLARAMGGGNENSAQDMTALIENGDLLRNKFGAAICWVHHSGKNESLGARGSSALLAATDIEVEVSEGVFRTTKMRDREGLEYRFRLKSVEVGKFSDGTAVTSCVVNWFAGPGELGQSTPGDKNLHLVIDILRRVGKPLTMPEIFADAELIGRKFTVKQDSVRRALMRACEQDTNQVFTREETGESNRNQKIMYRYGLANW